MNKTYKAALYCRLSEEDRFKTSESDDSGSIINQKELLSSYCEDRGWEIYGIYSDDDFTGSDRKRPEFNRLLRDAEDRKFDVIICKTQSRFTRELELVEKYINYLFPIWGIRFISVVDNADTSVKGNKKSRQINGLINEWYLEDMSENIKAVLTSRRKSGYFIGAFAPYGYKKDEKNKGHLVIDEEAAVTVRLIFDLYISGMGRTAIARELNARHIPTPTDYKLRKGERYKNNYTAAHAHLWRYFTVAGILTNEVYIGNLIQNKAHSISYKSKIVKPTPKSEWIKVENTHKPIIEKEVWEMAQNILSARTRPSLGTAEKNIFSKKVYCSECGKTMRISKQKNRKYLRCSTRYYAPEECVGVNISYKNLCSLLLSEFRSLVSEMADEDKISSCADFRNKSEEMLAYYRNERERVLSLAADNSNYLKNLYIDKVKGIIGETTYYELLTAFNSEKEEYEKTLSQINERIKAIREEAEISENKIALIKHYTDSNELTFEMVQTFVEKIIVRPKRPYSREDNIEIYWNF